MELSWDSDLRQRKNKRPRKGSWPYQSFTTDRKHWNDSLPPAVGYLIIIVFLIVLKYFSIFENSLPDQIPLKEANSHPGRFIGERAELQLKRLTDLGTKVVGSHENEVLAVDFLKREISYIIQDANRNYKIEVDVQQPTNSYDLFLRPYGFRNCYADIQNVVVKLSSNNSTNSVLLNCHYDTVPESPGASDNGMNCVVMLEILRVLATGQEPLKNNIIFLFNGAEENPLQGAHGFVSQHKWREEVRVVINLDSGGAGGKEILFQTSGEAWLVHFKNHFRLERALLGQVIVPQHSTQVTTKIISPGGIQIFLKAYARSVPRPSGGVQAEELFHFGIIPSDTDFRIFRDFGKYPGFDIAHCTNGYIYHTKYDKMDYIRPGVYQHTGDNVLALVKELVNSPQLGTEQPKTRMVYYDIFGLFIITYTEGFGVFLNILTVLLSFCAIYTSTSMTQDFSHFIKSLSISIGGQLLALLLGAVVVFSISKTLDLYNSTMSWYLQPWLIIPLYAFPILIAAVAMLFLVHTRMRKDSPGLSVVRFISAGQVLWTIVLFIGTLKGVRTSYMLMLIVLFPSIGSLIVTLPRKSFTVRTYLIAYTSCLVFPILFTARECVRIFTVIIPMTARMGPHVNAEVIIGALAFITSIVYLSQLIPILLLLRKLKGFMIVLCVIHVLAMIGVMGTKFGFPYDGDLRSPALQRFYILHTERAFYDAKGSLEKTDSGIFVQSLDRNNINYVSGFLPDLKEARTAFQDCSNELFCGFPVFTSRFIRPAPYSYWIPSEPIAVGHLGSLKVTSQKQISVHARRIGFVATGSDHITIGISPRKDVNLLKWSFSDSSPIESENWNDRKTYMIYYSYGVKGGTVEFDIDLEVMQNQTEPVMDVVVISHYMDPKLRTDRFKNFLSRFPDWVHLTPWTSNYQRWII